MKFSALLLGMFLATSALAKEATLLCKDDTMTATIEVTDKLSSGTVMSETGGTLEFSAPFKSVKKDKDVLGDKREIRSYRDDKKNFGTELTIVRGGATLELQYESGIVWTIGCELKE